MLLFGNLDRELTTTLILSGCFMLIFTADGTMLNMQKIIVSSIADEQPGFHVEGYTVNGLLYTMFVLSLLVGPYMCHAIGPRLTMFISAIGYLFYSASYLIETEWAIYLGALVTGAAAGTMWPAQGQYLIGNSTTEKTARNVAIFWFFFMASGLFGNIFVAIKFYKKRYINQTTRRSTIIGLLLINLLALIAFVFLPKSTNKTPVKEYGLIKAVNKSLSIIKSKRMRLLIITFCYVGFQQAFWSAVYSPSIGFTMAFGEYAKELVPLSGICMSVGALLGAFCPIMLASWIRRHCFARRLIIFLGISAQLLSFLIVFLNIPDSASFGNTDQISFIQPNAELALLCSVLLTFGDSCLSTQIYSFIGDFYRESSAEACALYKFFKGITIAASFYSCSHISLHTQLAILAVMAIFGLASFILADHKV